MTDYEIDQETARLDHILSHVRSAETSVHIELCKDMIAREKNRGIEDVNINNHLNFVIRVLKTRAESFELKGV